MFKLEKELMSQNDPYGTLVWYFNSIRELGYAKTLLSQDMKNILVYKKV